MTERVLIWRRCVAIYIYSVLLVSTVFVLLGMRPWVLLMSIPLSMVVGVLWVIPAAINDHTYDG